MPEKKPPVDDLFDQLKADVDHLGRTLGNVIRSDEGEDFFALVERVRGLTKRLRAGDDGGSDELAALLAGIDPQRAEGLVRAFTVYFQLINLAEEIHRVRVNRTRDGEATEESRRLELSGPSDVWGPVLDELAES